MGENGTSCGAFAWNISNSGSFIWSVPASGQVNAGCQLQDGNEYQFYINKYQDTYPYAYGPIFRYDADCMYLDDEAGGPPQCLEDCIVYSSDNDTTGTGFWDIFAPDSSSTGNCLPFSALEISCILNVQSGEYPRLIPLL